MSARGCHYSNIHFNLLDISKARKELVLEYTNELTLSGVTADLSLHPGIKFHYELVLTDQFFGERLGSSPTISVPNNSASRRSGCKAAQFKITKGLSVRRDKAWIFRAIISLPAPEGPTIKIRLLVGAKHAQLFVGWFAWKERRLPNRSWSPTLTFRSAFSRFRRADSIARCVTSNNRAL